MGITRHDTEMHGNNRLPPIDRMTLLSPDTYCVRAKAAGKNIIRYRFTDTGELPIHGF